MSENKATKDAKDLKLEVEKEAEIVEDIKEAVKGAGEVAPVAPVAPAAHSGGFQRKGRPSRFPRDQKENKDGFEEKVIAVDRVTRVVKGGRRMRFRALVVVGDKAGKIGYGTGKGNEVAAAVAKAVNKAKKDLSVVKIYNGTVLHDVTGKSRSTSVLLKTAKKGRGIIAGGSVRNVLELAGYTDIVAKSYGSNNKINTVIATIDALNSIIKSPKASRLASREENKEKEGAKKE